MDIVSSQVSHGEVSHASPGLSPSSSGYVNASEIAANYLCSRKRIAAVIDATSGVLLNPCGNIIAEIAVYEHYKLSSV